MAFCSSCGTQVADGSPFCSGCGAPMGQAQPMAAQQMMQQQMAMQQMMMNMAQQQGLMRQQAMDEMQRTINYFMVKKPQYDELDNVNARIDYLTGYRRPGFLVWGIILGVFGFTFFASGIGGAAGGGRGLAPVIIIGLVLLALSGLLIFFFIKKKKDVRNMLAAAVARSNELCAELDQYYKAFGYCVVGEEYSNPDILTQIADTIRTGRADNAKEAINVMLDDAHKTQMELTAAMTAASARQAANGATAAAVFSAASFFLG